jgi:hypothetical protein
VRPRARRHTPEQRERIVTRGGALASLSQHPSWPDFEAEFTQKIEQLRRRATSAALNPQGADQRELDVIRGSILTLRWLLAVPANAEARLEQYLRDQRALEAEQEDVA